MNLKRTFLAFLLAPLATPAVFVSVWLVTRRVQYLDDVCILFLLISIFAYSAAIVFGIPLVVLTRRKHSTKALFTATGAVAGLLVATALELFSFGWRSRFDFFVLCALAGGLSGLAFWAISYWRPIAEDLNEQV